MKPWCCVLMVHATLVPYCGWLAYTSSIDQTANLEFYKHATHSDHLLMDALFPETYAETRDLFKAWQVDLALLKLSVRKDQIMQSLICCEACYRQLGGHIINLVLEKAASNLASHM
jgi:predicted small integral membrane protein